MFGYRRYSPSWWKEVFSLRSYTRPIKRFYERGRYGIAVQDSWDLDHHLNKTIAKGLEYLIDKGYSRPMDFESLEQWHAKLHSIKWRLELNDDFLYKDGGIFDTHNIYAHSAVEYAIDLMKKEARKELLEIWPNLWD